MKHTVGSLSLLHERSMNFHLAVITLGNSDNSINGSLTTVCNRNTNRLTARENTLCRLI